MPVNKVEYFGETLIDISDSTITPEKVLRGEIGYNKAGTRFVGTAETAAEPVIKPLEVTSNGTYTAPDGVDGYSPVTVNVSGGGGEILTPKEYIDRMNSGEGISITLEKDNVSRVRFKERGTYILVIVSCDAFQGYIESPILCYFFSNEIYPGVSYPITENCWIQILDYAGLGFYNTDQYTFNIKIITDYPLQEVARSQGVNAITEAKALKIITGGATE